MSPQPKKRSTILVAVGAGVFVIGTGLAALATRDSGGTSHVSSTATTIAAVGAVAPATGVAAGAGFTIPPDHQAIAVSVPFVPGLAGVAKPGDLVNVYGAFKAIPVPGNANDVPAGKLVLQKVKVLALTPCDAGADATYVLSVSTSEAEAIIYLANFDKVWLTLARDDQGSLVPKGFSDNNA